MNEKIEEADLRIVVRLLGEVAALRGGLMAKRCHLLDGLCDFTGADEWRWAYLAGASTPVCLGFMRKNPYKGMALPATLPEPEGNFLEPLLLPPSASESRVIVSRCYPDNHTESRIALFRDPAGLPFPGRQAFLASLVLDEIRWLHWPAEKSRVSAELPPRLRLIRDLLLLGFGRKEIAAQVGISTGTVCGYMRDLYRQAGVKTQAQFIRHSRRNVSLS